MSPLTTLLLHTSEGGGTLSYQTAWPRAFGRDPRFDVTSIDVSRRARTRLSALRRRRYDLVIALHSVFSNAQRLPTATAARLAARGRAVVYFVGNEYKLMPEKMALAEAMGVDLLVSQIRNPQVHELYRGRLGCATIELPIIGFDPHAVEPGPPLAQRPVDIGYRGYDLTAYLGHEERRTAPEAFARLAAERGLRADISLDPEERLGESEWLAFLRRCRGQLGVSSGTDYFELTDETRAKVNALVARGAGFDDLREQVFDRYIGRVSGRALPGRVVEAAATKTVSILVEGDYGGYFEPDVHYIRVRRDLADASDALARLADDGYCERLVASAYDAALDTLTYEKLLDRLHAAVLPLVRG